MRGKLPRELPAVRRGWCSGLLGLSLMTVACDPTAWFRNDAPENATAAEASAPAGPEGPASNSAAVGVGTERVHAELGRSKIGFAVAKATSEHIAVFEDFSADAALENGEPTKLDIVIQMASLRSDREALTKHLKSSEFFDVDKYPTSRFTATAFRRARAWGQTHELTGTLTLHGIERELSFPAEILVHETHATGTAELTVDPRDYGIHHPALVEELVDTNVLLEIELRFPRPAK